MTEIEWADIVSAPEDEAVETCIHDKHGPRNIQRLRRRGQLWFFPDGSMYVYYTPTHWRPRTAGIEPGEK